MNTPPKKRRHDMTKPLQQLKGKHIGDAWFQVSLVNDDFAVCLARIIAEFVHLEGNMATVLAVLLGMPDRSPADYVWRTIASPRGRIDIMRTLLQQAPQNMKMPEVYDVIISDFSSINSRRNDLVHGQWFTNSKDGSVLLAKLNSDPHGLGWFAAEPIKLKELETLLDDIRQLQRLINQTAYPALWLRRHGANPPPPNERDPESDEDQRTGEDIPPPPPQSSET